MADPWATAANAPIPASRIAAPSSAAAETVAWRSDSASAYAARSAGVMSLGGVLPRSRARFWASVTIAARETPSAISWWALSVSVSGPSGESAGL